MFTRSDDGLRLVSWTDTFPALLLAARPVFFPVGCVAGLLRSMFGPPDFFEAGEDSHLLRSSPNLCSSVAPVEIFCLASVFIVSNFIGDFLSATILSIVRAIRISFCFALGNFPICCSISRYVRGGRISLSVRLSS